MNMTLHSFGENKRTLSRLSLREEDREENANIPKMQIFSRLGFHKMFPFLLFVLDLKIRNRFLFLFLFTAVHCFHIKWSQQKAILKYQSSVKKHNLEQ